MERVSWKEGTKEVRGRLRKVGVGITFLLGYKRERKRLTDSL